MAQKLLPSVVAQEALGWVLKLGDVTEADVPHQLALDLSAAEIATAETEARVLAAGMAVEMLKGIADAIRTGEIPERFARSDSQGLIAEGLSKYDPRIAFQAGLRSAYSAGRYERGMRSDQITHFVYRTMQDERVREEHQLLDGVALPKDDPFWKDHTPPLGWNCRCLTYSTAEAGISKLEDAGLPVQREAPDEGTHTYINKLTGEETTLPASIEPGWDFNPSLESERLAAMLHDRLDVALDAVAARAVPQD